MSIAFRVNDVAALAKFLADRRVPFEREGESQWRAAWYNASFYAKWPVQMIADDRR